MLPVFSRQIHTAVAPSLMRLDDQNTDLSADSAARSADEQLLRRYSETGSEEAFSQLVYRHAGWVYHFCRRRLNDSHLAEDATQAVFLLLARKIPTMPPPAHLAGWLFQACRYVLAETRRNDKRYRRRQDIARDVMLQRINASSLAEAAPDPHLSAALDDALVRLNSSERQTILMHFYEGLTLRQMADQLGISKEGAKKRVNRALAHLRRSLDGKIHRTSSRSSVAGFAVICWLLQSRRSEAAPTGLAETVAKSATVPGVSSSMAELMAHGVTQSLARARHKLLAILLLLILELLVIVPIAVLRGRGQHNAVEVSSAPINSTSSQPHTTIAALTPAQGDCPTPAPTDASPWLDPNAPSPPLRPYAPADDAEPSPQKLAAEKSTPPKEDPTPIALAQPLVQGGPMASSAQTTTNSARVTPSSIAYAPAQSNLLTAAQSALQFSQIKSAINRKARNLPNPIMTERQESETRPSSDDFKFPPPPPADRPPFDPFDRPPHRQGTYASARGDLRDYPDLPHHDREFPTERFEPYALLNSSQHDLDSSAILNLPLDFPSPDQHFSSMPMHPMFAALSDSIAFANDGAFLPPDTLFAFESGLSDSHFLYMSAVPEPATLLLLLISTTTLTLRPRRKRSDAI